MDVPLEIACPDFEKTEAIDNLIQEQAAKLERICSHLISCRVTLEMPQKSQGSGNQFQVRIETHIPPKHHLTVRRESRQSKSAQDPLNAVIHEAFEAMEEQVHKTVDKQRGHVKKHPQQETSGFVSKVFPEEGYGFIESVNGDEIYFHKNSVLHDDFERLQVGTGVRFVEDAGENGAHATTVQSVDRPGIRSS
ncbi:MAG: HPF/RaiA family ribosome-associated protein [Verrucomicrobiota bacterium]